MIFGYARVSTQEQHLERQLDELVCAGVDSRNIFIEKAHGAKARPELERLLGQLRKDDVIIICDLTRISRSTADLLNIIGRIKDKGALIKSLKDIRRTINRLNSLTGDKKTEIVVGPPKSENSVRDIPFNEVVRDEFVRYKEKTQLRLGKLRNDDYILMLRRGFPIEPKTMQDCLRRIEIAAGISSINFHALRHTFATRAVEKGADIKTLSVILGHSDVTVTLKFYTHVQDEQKRNVMNLLMQDY